MASGTGEVLTTLAWKHPAETPQLLEKLRELRGQRYNIFGVMESSGSYGDVLRHQLQAVGLLVYQVSGKRVHDAKVVYDDVASLRDAKCSGDHRQASRRRPLVGVGVENRCGARAQGGRQHHGLVPGGKSGSTYPH